VLFICFILSFFVYFMFWNFFFCVFLAYSKIIAVCSQIHTKHINTLCGQNVECCVLNLDVHVVTTELRTREVDRIWYDSFNKY
jgi:hypothetical protein